MEINNLYEKVLIEPANKFNELFIVVGYGTPSFLIKHLTDLKKKYKNSNHKINLIIGMEKKGLHILDSLILKIIFLVNFQGIKWKSIQVT